MEKFTRKVRVKNDLGLHTRPATAIVQALRSSKSEVFFTHRKETVNAKSILSILMLAAQKNAHVTITACGEDAVETLEGLVTLFEQKFGEG